ncbi:hypothetical protein HNV11_16090 [Spirosoma taeanense]|uniref:Uncharacterized protein n=1 Tax=Spirosoma taeanense TaxID=2735870 RepID=A0A6M5YBX3_9BACT|nr:hypothetical protein [Spirosoma taeanense]QJW90790.1 hypothetical protein HNV11_16090 [Spirosoma taeanense]
MKYGYFFLLIASLTQSACSQKALVRFSQKPPELVSADVLTEIMLVNKSPKIVLRVPITRKGVTNTQGTGNQQSGVVNPVVVRQINNGRSKARIQYVESQYDETALYNAIEKQLFKEGFSVRDRGLFNEVLDDNQSIDYSKITALTNTDLILELVRIDNLVGYTTNVCYADDEEKPINGYRTVGASVEFKLVHVKTNEIVGSYKIHYTPCLDGCRGLYRKGSPRGHFTDSPWLKPGELRQLQKLSRKPQETLDQDELELFIANATHQLVQTMR